MLPKFCVLLYQNFSYIYKILVNQNEELYTYI